VPRGQKRIQTKAVAGPAGRLSSVTLPNGIVVSFGYDKDSQVASLTYGSLGSLIYGYDPDGRRNSVSGSFARTIIPLAQSYSYNADNSLKTVSSVTATNDNDGNITCLLTSGCPQYAYDARGHLAEAVPSGGSAIFYGYDVLGRRISDSAVGFPPNPTTFMYDGLNQVASWVGSPSSGINSYLEGTGLDDFFNWSASGTNESFLRDALGSTVALTNSSVALLDQYTYDPYGNSTDSQGLSTNPFMYVGRELSDASGFYYMRGRYYSPGQGRFISRDPIGLAGGLNMYAYAGDDPVDFSDPTGSDYGWIGGVAGGWFGTVEWINDEGYAFGGGGGVGPETSAFLQVFNRDGLDIRQGRLTNGGILDPDDVLLLARQIVVAGDMVGNWEGMIRLSEIRKK
jgi:RHS repeat-associated protein